MNKIRVGINHNFISLFHFLPFVCFSLRSTTSFMYNYCMHAWIDYASVSLLRSLALSLFSRFLVFFFFREITHVQSRFNLVLCNVRLRANGSNTLRIIEIYILDIAFCSTVKRLQQNSFLCIVLDWMCTYAAAVASKVHLDRSHSLTPSLGRALLSLSITLSLVVYLSRARIRSAYSCVHVIFFCCFVSFRISIQFRTAKNNISKNCTLDWISKWCSQPVCV